MPTLVLILLAGMVTLILHAIAPPLALLGLSVAGVLLFQRQQLLERRLRDWQAGERNALPAQPPVTVPPPTGQAAPVPPAIASPIPVEPPAAPTPVRPVAPPLTPPTPAAAPSGAPRPAPRAAGDDAGSLPGPLRWLLTGNPLAKIGMLLLFFGLAYLFRYASERNLLPLEVRLAGAALLAMGLLVTGWRLRLRQTLYGLILQGTGIGSLYLIIFAAWRLDIPLPMPLAFGLMLVICGAGTVLAIVQRAQSLAMGAALGGFLAPLLLSTGSGNYIGLFSYYLLLSCGLLVLNRFQSWRSVNLVGFVFTFGTGTLWGIDHYRPEMYVACQLFLLAFLLIYGVIALLFAFCQPLRLRGFVDGTLVFGSPLIGFGLQYGLTHHWAFGPAFSAIAFAAVYLPLAGWLLRTRPEHGRLLGQAFFALALVFLTLAIPLGLSASWTAVAWALEGAGLCWVGCVQQQRRMTWPGQLLLLGATVSWVSFIDHGTVVALTCSGMVVAVAWLLAGLVLFRHASTALENLVLSRINLGLGLLVWMLTLPLMLDRLEPRVERYTFATLWLTLMCVSTLAWHSAGRRFNWRALGHGSWLLWPVMLLCIADPAHPIAGWGWLVWPLTLATALLHLKRREHETHELLIMGLQATLLWLLAALAMTETLWRLETGLLFVQEWGVLARMVVPAAVVALVLLAQARRWWPVQGHAKAWLGAGCVPLLLLLVLGLAGANSQDGRVRELQLYLPLLNPLDLAALAAGLALIGWMRAVEGHWRRPAVARSTRLIVAGVIAFWWISGALVRAVAQAADVPWHMATLWQSQVVQASLALFWTLCALALMWLSARRSWRPIWLAGAVLLGVVIIKLMLVDSAVGGGLTRAIAFIGVALLLLLIGYLAPLPPAAAATSTSGESHV